LNEIPNQIHYEMTNFIAAFLPAITCRQFGTDGFIRIGIASPLSIITSKRYLHSYDLNQWATRIRISRATFEVQIAVRIFPTAACGSSCIEIGAGYGQFDQAWAKRARSRIFSQRFFCDEITFIHTAQRD